MKSYTKNYAFIDSQNLYLAILAQGWKIDLKRFRIYLKDKYNIEKAFLFLGYLPENQEMYRKFQEYGYILIFKPILRSKNSKIKGNVDAELVLHSMIQYLNYDKAVIVTGDGDFYCLVDYLSQKDKLEKLLIPNFYKYSGLLKLFPGEKLDFVNNLRNKVEQKREAIAKD